MRRGARAGPTMPHPKGRGGSASATRSSTRWPQQALANSPSLALAEARLAQSRAVLAATSAAVLPQLGLGARAARQKISANRPLSSYASPNFSTVQNDLLLAMSVNYEFDLAGRLQRSIEGAGASLEQSAADLENTRLLLTTDLATTYYNLRALDIELDVLDRAIALLRPCARAGAGALRPRRGHRAGRGAAAGAARHARWCRSTCSSASAISSSMRSPRWWAWPRRLHAGARHARAHAARGAAGRAVRRAGAAARHRVGRACDGGGQRADRRCQRGVLSERDAEPHAGTASRAARCRRCSTRRACCGRWACRPRRCCSTTGA